MQNYSLFGRILEKMPSLYLSEISLLHSLIYSTVFANVIKQFDGIARKKTYGGKESDGCIGKKSEPRSKIYSVSMPLSSSVLHSESLEGLLPGCRLKFCGTRVRFKCQVPEARIRRRIFIQHGTNMCMRCWICAGEFSSPMF